MNRFNFRAMMIMLAACLGLVSGQPVLAQPPADPVGDWNGDLTTPLGNLTIILSVAKGVDGALKGELESVSQAPGVKIPVNRVAVEGGHLIVEIGAINASYKADWIAATQSWQGIFSQGADLPLKLSRGLPPPKPVVAGMDGLWNGKITVNGVDLRLVLRIRSTAVGTAVLLDSPDQLANGLPVQDFAREGNKVRFKLQVAAQSYEGTLSDDGTKLSGLWTVPTQPAPLPLTFTRGDASALAPPRRPQTPQPPFPYAAEEVGFDNVAQPGVHLAGTLTLPQGKGPFPAAIMITGSGQQDRDETLFAHKPFAVIADYLTRRGIAVLRVDDRGVGKSKGSAATATSADFATDANAAFAYLRTRAEIRPNAIGFIGHSEGGMIGPIAMADNKDVAFLVMMAGPGTALDKLMLSQRRLIGVSMGLTEAQIARAEPVMAALMKAVISGSSFAEGQAAARAVLTPDAMVALGAPPTADPQIVLTQIANPWFRYFLAYDPAPNLRRIRVPVLALNGSLDRQVPAAENLPAIRAALKDDRDVTIVELPGLNHLFQTAKTGAVGEYGTIEETVAPVALERMASWIETRFVKK